MWFITVGNVVAHALHVGHAWRNTGGKGAVLLSGLLWRGFKARTSRTFCSTQNTQLCCMLLFNGMFPEIVGYCTSRFM